MHFSLLVVTKTNDPKELEDSLAPFQEYDSIYSKNKDFVEFIDCSENIEEKKEEGESWEEFAESWGYEIVDGVIGFYQNPNRKWDWWQVGGRFSGGLTSLGGHERNHGHRKDLDFSGKIQAQEASKDWKNANEIIDGRELISHSEFVKRGDSGKFYSQKVLKDLMDQGIQIFHHPENYWLSEQEYVEWAGKSSVATYAFLDIDGNWHCRENRNKNGELVKNENWHNDFIDLINKVDQNSFIWLVDCHV